MIHSGWVTSKSTHMTLFDTAVDDITEQITLKKDMSIMLMEGLVVDVDHPLRWSIAEKELRRKVSLKSFLKILEDRTKQWRLSNSAKYYHLDIDCLRLRGPDLMLKRCWDLAQKPDWTITLKSVSEFDSKIWLLLNLKVSRCYVYYICKYIYSFSTYK